MTHEIWYTTRGKKSGDDHTAGETVMDKHLLIVRYNELVIGKPVPDGNENEILESVTIKEIKRHKDKDTGEKKYY